MRECGVKNNSYKREEKRKAKLAVKTLSNFTYLRNFCFQIENFHHLPFHILSFRTKQANRFQHQFFVGLTNLIFTRQRVGSCYLLLYTTIG